MSDALTPIRVSPFIKLARWSLLFLGIWYGSTRWNYLHRKEEKYRAYLREMKPQWDAEAAVKKAEAERLQNEELKKNGLDLGGPLA